MVNRMLSVFTGFAAALLLVGVAWATSDSSVEELGAITTFGAHCDESHDHGDGTEDDGASGSAVLGGEITAEATANEDDGDSGIDAEVEVKGEAANTSDDSNDPSAEDSTGGQSEGTTTTTVASDVTTTTVASDTTTTTEGPDDADDGVNDEHKHFLLDITGGVQAINAGKAGTLKVKALLGHLILIDVDTNAGWDYKVRKYTTSDIEVRFFNHESQTDLDIELSHDGLIVDLDIFAD